MARHVRRWLIALVLAPLTVALVCLWLLGRESTLQYVAEKLVANAGGVLSIEGVGGGLYDAITFKRVEIRTPEQRIVLEQGRFAWRPSTLLSKTFSITEMRVERVVVDVLKSSPDPLKEPASLELPGELTLALSSLHVGEIEIRQKGNATRLSNLDLVIDYRDRRWRIDKASVVTPWGRVTAGLELAAVAPFDLIGEVALRQSKAGSRYEGAAKLRGPLREIQVDAGLSVKADSSEVNGTGSAIIAPFKAQPLSKAQVRIARLSPRWLDPSWPDGDLSVRVDIEPQGREGFKGQAHIDNRAPGTIDRQHLPLVSLDLIFSGDADRVDLGRIAIDLGAGGTWQGTGAWKSKPDGGKGQTGLTLVTRNFNLNAVHSKLRRTTIQGEFAAAPVDGSWRVRSTLGEATLGLDIDALVGADLITVDKASLRAGGGHFDFSGKMALGGTRDFVVKGRADKFNPADLGKYPAAMLGADIDVTGELTPLRVKALIALKESRFRGLPLSGHARFALDGGHLDDVDIALSLGANRIVAKGGFGMTAGATSTLPLAWKIDVPKLSDLGVDFNGSLLAEGEAAGNPAVFSGHAKVDARDLKWMDALSVKNLQGRLRIDANTSKGANAFAVNGELDLTDLVSGKWAIAHARASLSGDRQRHRMTAEASLRDYTFSAEASGGLGADMQWTGEVAKLDARGRVPVTLMRPATLRVGREGRVELGATQLAIDSGKLDIAQFRLGESGWASRGSASGIPVALIFVFAENLKRDIDTDLKLGAVWDLAMETVTANSKVAPKIGGMVRVFRESGDVEFRTEPRFKAGLDQLEMRADIVDRRVNAAVTASGRDIGKIKLAGSALVDRVAGIWGIPGKSPITFSGDADIPSLRWLARFGGEPGMSIDGRLRATVSGNGTFAEPRMHGEATARGVELTWPEQGVQYRGGELDAVFDNDGLIVKRMTMASGGGRLDAAGKLIVSRARTSGTIDVKLDRFTAFSRPDRLLILSGDGKAELDDNRLAVTGNLKADRGLIELPDKSSVTMSDDVVVIGKEVGREADGTVRKLATRVDIGIDAGDRFAIKGAGLEGTLKGTMRVTSEGSGLPRAVGSLRIESATYTVYGVKLAVERGVLNFSGPIHNPGIDLLALRKNQTVEAGVEVRGSVTAPQARLVSTPNVADTEKLSWLVLGRGLDRTTQADFSLLSAAAGGLLGSSQATSLQAKIAGSLGLDSFGVSSAGTEQGGLLSVGKRLSSRLYASYEQGLGKASNLLKIRYTLSKRWSLQAQAGTESAVDVLYTLTFD